MIAYHLEVTHVMLCEHREFLPPDPWSADAVGEVSFLAEDGTQFIVPRHGIPDTEAALGWAGSHTVVVDRPDGKAGGKGLGFDGGELLGLAMVVASAMTCNMSRMR